MLGICGISRLHRHVTGMAIKQKSGNVAFSVAIVGQASLEACPFCFADLLRFGDQFVPETKNRVVDLTVELELGTAYRNRRPVPPPSVPQQKALPDEHGNRSQERRQR